MARGPVISVQFQAGTGGLIAGAKAATATIKDFSAQTTGGMQRANAAVRVLDLNFQSNTRAVSRFLVETLKLGPALNAAFAVVGPILFIKLIIDAAEKVHAFFKGIQEESRKAAIAFRELNAPLALTITELRVAGDRLDNDIAKLEGKRQNTLKLALDEAALAAQKLADALDKDLAKLDETLEKQKTTWYGEFFGSQGSTDPLIKLAKDTRESLAGAKDNPAEQIRILNKALEDLAAMSKTAKAAQEDFNTDLNTGATFALDETKNLRNIAVATAFFNNQLELLNETRSNAAKTAKKEQLEAGIANEKPGLVYANEVTSLQARLAGVRAELSAIGRGHEAEAIAKAFLAANEAIAKVNIRLKELHTANLTGAQEGVLRGLFGDIAKAEGQTEVARKIDETTNKLSEEAAAYRDLASAIGLSYEATRKAAIAAELAKTKEYANASPEQRIGLELAAQEKFDDEHEATVKRTLYGLQQEIALTQRLASVASQGAVAEQRVQLAEEQIQAIRNGEWQKAIDLALKYHLERTKADADELRGINVKLDASRRLAAAIGERGKQEAEAENARQEVLSHGGGGGVADAAYRAKLEEEQTRLAEEGNKLANEYSDHIQKINDIEAQIVAHSHDQLQTMIALREQTQERLKLESEYELKQRTLSSGVRAFFLDMQQDAESAGQIVYNSLHTALDRISEEFGKLFTGGIKKKDIRGSFGKLFEGLGESAVQNSVKSAAQYGLGKLGSALGIQGLGPKPDGSSADRALWVRMAWGVGGGAASLLSNIFIPHAAGGPTVAGVPYLVGENGPEIRSFSSSGSIVPISGGGGNVSYQIDARGADLGAANRIARVVEASHRSAISTSVQANAERARRTPRMTR